MSHFYSSRRACTLLGADECSNFRSESGCVYEGTRIIFKVYSELTHSEASEIYVKINRWSVSEWHPEPDHTDMI